MIYLILLLLLTATPAWAIPSVGTAAGTTSVSDGLNTLCVNVTVAADDTAVLFIAGGSTHLPASGDGGVLFHATYDGAEMVPIGVAEYYAVSGGPLAYAWIAPAPSSGTKSTCVVNKNTTYRIVIAAVPLKAADQTALVHHLKNSNGTGAAASVTGYLSSGDLGITVLICGNSNGATGSNCPTVTTDAGQTQIIQQTSTENKLTIGYTTNTTVTWTLGASAGNREWAALYIPVRPTMTRGAPVFPALQIFEHNAKKYGDAHMVSCDAIYTTWIKAGKPTTAPGLQGCTYYHGSANAMWLADYLGSAVYAAWAGRLWEMTFQGYVEPNSGGVPGYTASYAEQLLRDYERRRWRTQNVTDAVNLRNSQAYGKTTSCCNQSADVIRENSWGSFTDLSAIKMGQAASSDRALMREQLYDHYDKLFVSRTYGCGNGGSCQSDLGVGVATGDWYGQPFIFGIFSEVLIADWEVTGESRAKPALKTIVDFTWDQHMGTRTIKGSSTYAKCMEGPNGNYVASSGPGNPPTLPMNWVLNFDVGSNPCILHNFNTASFAWIADQYNDPTYITDKADVIWTSATLWGYQGLPKPWNEMLWRGKVYIERRNAYWTRRGYNL